MNKKSLIPIFDQPLRRVSDSPQTCNYRELLAALVGGPRQIEVADQILVKFGSLQAIQKATLTELVVIEGIGRVTVARIRAALEIGRRIVNEIEEPRPQIFSPASVANLIQYDMQILEQEELWVILLNTRNAIIDTHKVYKGSLNSSQVRVGELFRDAIRKNAAAVIIAHNHPSGDPTPSPDDVALTRAVVEAGRLVDIELLDHLVIGQGRFVSMKERRLGF